MTNYEKLVSTDPKFRGMTIRDIVEHTYSCDFCKYKDMDCVYDDTMDCVDGVQKWLESEVEE